MPRPVKGKVKADGVSVKTDTSRGWRQQQVTPAQTALPSPNEALSNEPHRGSVPLSFQIGLRDQKFWLLNCLTGVRYRSPGDTFDICWGQDTLVKSMK